MQSKHNWFMRLLIAIDQLFNVIFNGYPDETISARAHRRAKAGSKKWVWAEKFINILFFLQPDHCAKAYRFEMRRGDMDQEYWR